MKQIIIFALLLAFLSCSQPADEANVTQDEFLAVLPSLSVAASSVGASRVVIDSNLSRAESLYVTLCPILYEFKENDSGKVVGDSFVLTSDVLGDINFSTSKAGSVISYTGTNDDDSLRISISYDVSTKKFSYSELAYINDSNKVFSDGVSAQNLLIYVEISDILLNNDFTFQGSYNMLSISYLDYYEQFQFMVVPDAEIYHGELTTGTIGTGCAIADLSGAVSNSDFSFMPDDINRPTNVSDLVDLDNMSNYIDSIGISGFISGATMNTTAYQAFYGDGSVFTEVAPEGNDEFTLATFLEALPDVWAENSLLNE